MKAKISTVAAIICLITMFACDVQAMAKIIGNGVEVQNCGIKIRRVIVRPTRREIVIAPVIVIENRRRYRHRYLPPPPPPCRHRIRVFR